MQVTNKWKYSELGRHSLAFSITRIILYSPFYSLPSLNDYRQSNNLAKKDRNRPPEGNQGGKIITSSSICCKNRKNMMMGTQSHFSQVLLWQRRVKTFPKNGIKRTKQACNALVSTCCFCCDMYMLHTFLTYLDKEQKGGLKLSFPKVS